MDKNTSPKRLVVPRGAKSSRFDMEEVGDESPQQFQTTPFGTKIVVVLKSDTKESAEVFKRPHALKPSAAKKHRNVLSEEKFADALEKIIERDCFPELEKLKAQNAYLDAIANNDIQMMRELSIKYGVGRRIPSLVQVNDSPATFETPSSIRLSTASTGALSVEGTPIIHETSSFSQSTPSSVDDDDADNQPIKSVASSSKTTASSKKPHELGLNDFLNRYTSEDDKSFQDIIDEGIRKHQLKYSWLYDQEEVHKERMQLAAALPSASQQQSIENQRPSKVETWTYKNKNALMYIPDGVPFTNAELADLARKQNQVDFKNTRFVHSHYKSTVEPSSGATTPSGGKPLNLIQGVTDFKVGMDGKEISSGVTPSVNGFKYVRTPSPTPGIEETPFLTWGEIEGTPFKLDASDKPIFETASNSTPYRMMETSRRERLALELADEVSSRHRDKKRKTIGVAKFYLGSPSSHSHTRPKTSMEQMNAMSPAAQAFAKNMLKNIEQSPRPPRK